MKISNRVKKFLFFFLALIITGFFIYLIFPVRVPEEISNGEIPIDYKDDKFAPVTAVMSPAKRSWHNKNFEVVIADSDLGSGLVDFQAGKKGCEFLIVDLGTGKAAGDFRPCESFKLNVPAGEGRICSSSYSREHISFGKCKISTRAFDKAGNSSGWKSRTFNTDIIKPEIEKVIIEQNLEMGQEYVFEARVSDNSKITGCWFYVNERDVGAQIEFLPIPSEQKDEYELSLDYSFDREGDFQVNFGCRDIADNLGLGEPVSIKVTTNHPPEIVSCRVNPTQGTSETEFRFSVEVSDPDGDELFYFWDFGDGKTSSEQNPIYLYENTGIFEPKVSVSDIKNAQSQCSTAWVTISQI